MSPIDLEAAAARTLREELPEASFDSGRSTVTVRVPDEPALRLAAVVTAAEAILASATAPAGVR